MVAAADAIDFGRPTELAHGDDECVVEKPTVGEILHQGGEGAVELGAEHIANAAGVVGVGVPERASGDFGLSFAGPVHLDQAGAGFDETAGEQGALAEFVMSVGVAQGGGFPFQFEGAPAGVGVKHFEGFAV